MGVCDRSTWFWKEGALKEGFQTRKPGRKPSVSLTSARQRTLKAEQNFTFNRSPRGRLPECISSVTDVGRARSVDGRSCLAGIHHDRQVYSNRRSAVDRRSSLKSATLNRGSNHPLSAPTSFLKLCKGSFAGTANRRATNITLSDITPVTANCINISSRRDDHNSGRKVSEELNQNSESCGLRISSW